LYVEKPVALGELTIVHSEVVVVDELLYIGGEVGFFDSHGVYGCVFKVVL